jgi:hypothetical protein
MDDRKFGHSAARSLWNKGLSGAGLQFLQLFLCPGAELVVGVVEGAIVEDSHDRAWQSI